MSPIIEAASSLGPVGLGILGIAIASLATLKAIDLARSLAARRNGNPTGTNRNGLRLICPLAPGGRTLDDVHSALVDVSTGINRMAEKQADLLDETRDRARAVDTILTDLRLDLAARGARREG